MKIAGIISTAVLSLTLGATATAFAQQEQHDQKEEEKAKPVEKKAQPEKPVKQDERNAQQQDKNKQQQEKSAQQQDNKQQEQKNAQQQDRNQQGRKNAQQSGKQEQHAGGNGGGRIPDDRFRANFGQEHRFRVSQADYGRDRHFQYGGYSFGFVDPWPSNWLYTQDVFVVEIDGVYYLCNASYPGVNIALSVTL
jgi:hypothetical protein